MFHRENSVLRRGSGVAVQGAIVTVFVNGTDAAGDYTNATKAPIFSDAAGTHPISGSALTTDANGRYEYFIADGVYDEQLKYGGIVEVDDYIQMFDLAGGAAAIAAANSAAQSASLQAKGSATAAAASAAAAALSEGTSGTNAANAAASAATAGAARDAAVNAGNAAQTSANAAETSRSNAAVSEANAAASAAAAAASAAGGGGGGGGVTTNGLQLSSAGDGATAGQTFNGSAAIKISYNSIGAQQANGRLQAFAGLTWTTGVQIPVLTGVSSVAMRAVGAASATDLLDRQSADARYQAAGSYLTGNQSITVSGDASGSGSTAITLTIGANKVTRGMLAATAGARLLGSTTAGNVSDLTAAQAKTLLAITPADVAGLSAIATSGSGADLGAGTVALGKLANVAAATVFYRKTAGSGAPEVQPLSTLKTDLGLTGSNAGDQQIASQADNAASIPASAPAGGTGTAAGGWDTAAHRDAAIATINALVAAVTSLQASHNSLLAKLRSGVSGLPIMATVGAPAGVPGSGPVVTGTAQDGSTLTGTTGSFTNVPTSYTEQWYSNTVASTSGGTPIPGANSLTFAQTSAQVGKYLYLGVIANNASGIPSSEVFSNVVGPVAAATLSAGFLDFNKPTYGGDWTTGKNPTSLYFELPAETQAGDFYQFRVDDDPTFASPSVGDWIEVTPADALKIADGQALTYTLAGQNAGVENFQMRAGRGADAAHVTLTSSWFGSAGANSYITDTLNSLATASIASYPNPIPTMIDDTTSTHHVNNVAFGDATNATWAIAVNPTSNQLGTLFNLTPSAGGTTKTGAQKAAGTYGDGQNWNVWAVPLNAGENANYNVNLAEAGLSLIRPAFFTLKGNPIPVYTTTVNVESGNPTTLPTLPVGLGQIGVWTVYGEDVSGGQTNSGTGTLLAQGGNGNQALLYKVTDNTQQPKVAHFGSGNFRAIGLVFGG